MNAREELNEIYLQWHALSEAEHEAIRGFDWERLAVHQQQKLDLQQRIQAIERRRVAPQRPGQGAASDQPALQSMLQELVRMETENHRQLEAYLASARLERDQLRQSSLNLRRLHRAYVNTINSVWQSYS